MAAAKDAPGPQCQEPATAHPLVCESHWTALPAHVQGRLARAYRPAKATQSDDYMNAAEWVQRWIDATVLTQQFVGKTEAEAARLAADMKMRLRRVGRSIFGTADFRHDRINVEIDANGVVTAATNG